MDRLKQLKKITVRGIRYSLIFRIVGGALGLLVIFGVISSYIGYRQYTVAFTRQYTNESFYTAETAGAILNGDTFEEYLKNGPDENYYETLKYLNILLQKQHVTLIYVISVDTSDYGRFKSVYNAVEEGSGYTLWELGYERETTNDEYREAYRQIYEDGAERKTVVRTSDLNGKVPHITSLIPVKGSDGKVKGILCVQQPMEELSGARKNYIKAIAKATILLIIICVLIDSALLLHYFIRPVKLIVDETERFSNENTRVADNRLLNLSKITELNILATAIDRMEEGTVTYMNKLTKATAEKQRISTEFELANGIQTHAMPNIFPVFPEHNNFELYATMEPAKEIGGDFYDSFMVDERHLVLVTADVSGKGIPAALFMMISKTIIKNQAGFSLNPAEILQKSNEQLCDGNIESMFVTVWLAVIDIETGEMNYSMAGHEKPVIKHDGVWELQDVRSGMPLGCLDSAKFKNEKVILSPGDMVFEYTDGVTEAQDDEDNMYRDSRLLETLNKTETSIPNYVIAEVRADIAEFVGDAEQFDDITMMCFCFRKQEKVLCEEEMGRISIDPADKAAIIEEETDDGIIRSVQKIYDTKFTNIEDWQNVVMALTEPLHPDVKNTAVIKIVIDEMLENIDKYAYPGGGRGEVTAEGILDVKRKKLTLRFIDSGIAFDPTAQVREDEAVGIDELEKGGLGIFVSRSRVDTMEYRRVGDKNVLTMTKVIENE